MQPTRVEVTPAFKGHVTASDVLSTEGTFIFATDVAAIQGGGVLFSASHPGFHFAFQIHNGILFLERNAVRAELSLTDLADPHQRIIVTAVWSASHLHLRCISTGVDREQIANTPPAAPPPQLIEWARRNNLVSTQTYDSEELFRQKVHSCLQSLPAKIHAAKAHTSFWNVSYDGNRVASKKPKKETEIQPLIHCLLSDQMLLNGIELIPEYQTGAGDVDFVFSAIIKDGGIRKFCVEFKLAHSTDLAAGLWHQLPQYMRHTGATYGAYCVVYFGAEWISTAVVKSGNTLDMFLTLVPNEVCQPEHDHIRSFVIDIDKQPTASKAR